MTHAKHDGTLREETVRVKGHKVTRWIFDFHIGAENRTAIIRADSVKVNGVVYDRWLVDFGAIDGKRERKSFPTMPEAEQYAKTRAVELASRAEAQVILNKKIGEDALKLGNDALHDAVLGLKILDGQGTLTDAATFYMQHTNPPGGKRTVKELLDQYIQDKIKGDLRDRSIQDIRHRLGRLSATFGDVLSNRITTVDLEKWLDRNKCKKASRLNYKRVLVSFFNYAIRHKFCKENPATAIEKPKIDEKIPCVFTPKQINHLMAVVAGNESSMTPYFAIATFAGVRPNETQQLDWRDIDLNKRRIRIIPTVAKKRRQRYVDISDNLLLWLLPYRQEQGQIAYSRKAFERVIRLSKLKWSSDVLRHSFASYHLARHEDAALTSLQLGHTSMDVLFNHYRNLVTREDAAEFWSIKPDRDTKVMPFAATA